MLVLEVDLSIFFHTSGQFEAQNRLTNLVVHICNLTVRLRFGKELGNCFIDSVIADALH